MENNEYVGLPVFRQIRAPGNRSQSIPGYHETVEEAKRRLLKLSRAKASGKFKGTDFDFKKKEAQLRKVILGG
jgi:hypothetical protein